MVLMPSTSSCRKTELAHVFRPDAAKPVDILASFRRFYFDTALSASPASLPSLKAFAQPGHIVFRTDFPFAPAPVAASFTAKQARRLCLFGSERIARLIAGRIESPDASTARVVTFLDNCWQQETTPHRTKRLLRATILGANDGILSTWSAAFSARSGYANDPLPIRGGDVQH